jgi:hypothetical protein
MKGFQVDQYLMGGITVACLAVGLFFFLYWRRSGDRFFIFLTLSFWLEAGNRAYMAMALSLDEDLPVHYIVRLVTYCLILAAIWDKNRPRGR